MEDARDYSFLTLFKDYFRYSTDAPIEFADILGVQILGHAMGYDSINMIQPKAVHHNMYTLLIGKSTLSRKTTSQDLAKTVYEKFGKNAADESSPERFVTDLAERPETFWFMGEFSMLLKGIKSGGYMASYAEVLNHIHGCPDRYRRKLQPKKGEPFEFYVEKPYLSVNSTITPEVLYDALTVEIANGGLLARYLMRIGTPNVRPRDRLRKRTIGLMRDCQNMLEALGQMDRRIKFVFDEEAMRRFNEIEMESYQRESVDPYVGRDQNYVVAVADILLVSDAIGYAIANRRNLFDIKSLVELVELIPLVKLVEEDENGKLVDISINSTNNTNSINHTKWTKDSEGLMLTVPVEYVNRAYEIIKPCLDSAEEVIKHVELDKPLARVRDVIRSAGEIGYSDALRNSNMRVRVFQECYETLIDRKEVVHVKPKMDGLTPITKTSFKWIGK